MAELGRECRALVPPHLISCALHELQKLDLFDNLLETLKQHSL